MNENKSILKRIGLIAIYLIVAGTASSQTSTPAKNVALKEFTPGALWPDNTGTHINAYGGHVVEENELKEAPTILANRDLA